MKKLALLVLLVGAGYFVVTEWALPFMDAQNLRSKYSEAALAAKVFASENVPLNSALGQPLKVGLHHVLAHAAGKVTLQQDIEGGRKQGVAVSEVEYADGAWKVVSFLVSYEGEAEAVQFAR